MIADEDDFLDEEYTAKYGIMYQGKDVNEERDHYIFMYPLAFFYRRTFFIVVTVFLFEWPYM